MLYFLIEKSTNLEIFSVISQSIIALFSIGFSVYIFCFEKKKDKKSLKLDWYKLIIIEHKFGDFFVFFDEIDKIMSSLKEDDSITNRKEVNDKLMIVFRTVELNLISLLLSVERMFYECVKKQFDNLVDGITERLSDSNIGFTDSDINQEELLAHISSYKVKILKMFVDFKGDSDSHKNLN